MSIWILIDRFGCSDSVKRITDWFDKIKYTKYQLVLQDDIVYKITQNKLHTYIKGEEITCYPAVLYCRIHSDCLKVDFHIPLFRHLELNGVHIVNSIDAMMKTTNKVWHFLELAKHDIPLPTTLSYCSNEIQCCNPKESLEYPIIAKSVRGNKGNKVFTISSKIHHEEMLGVLQHDVPYLYQDYIKESHGRDLRIIVVNKKPVYAMIRTSLNGSVRANLSQGGHGEIVTGKYQDAEELAVRIAGILDIAICGVDLLIRGEGDYLCCEVNNTPGLGMKVYDGADVEKYIGEYLIRLIG